MSLAKNMVDLSAAFKKIDRARRKLELISELSQDWMSEGHVYSVRRDVKAFQAHVIVGFDKLPPEEIAWELVEGVGHLRSALDKMIVTVAKHNGKGDRRIGFPFAGLKEDGTPQLFPNGRHFEVKDCLTTEQWQIIEAAKPFAGGNDVLLSVNNLANVDKHREELVQVRGKITPENTEIIGGVFVGSENVRVGFYAGGDPSYEEFDPATETLLFSYAFGPGSVHPEIRLFPQVDLVLGPIQPVEGREVIGLFESQISIVQDIIERFDTQVLL